jgi:hypothetical protein
VKTRAIGSVDNKIGLGYLLNLMRGIDNLHKSAASTKIVRTPSSIIAIVALASDDHDTATVESTQHIFGGQCRAKTRSVDQRGKAYFGDRTIVYNAHL